MTTLGVRPPDIVPKATHHIDEIIAMIEQWIAQQHAYEPDHVLFHVPRTRSTAVCRSAAWKI